jgi:hypothetical protein
MKVVFHVPLPLVPRTREGYYHYTGGIEVRCPILISFFLRVYVISSGRNQTLNGVRPIRGPYLVGNQDT